MKKHWKLYLLLTGVVAAQIAYGLVTHKLIPNWQTSGTFGDTFGAINSLFSGLAFAALIYTIVLQSRELTLQREELALTREQLTESAKSQRDQAIYMLLATQISAAISKQEIYANHYVNQKQFPGQEQYDLGQMRRHLQELMLETDRLVKEAGTATGA